MTEQEKEMLIAVDQRSKSNTHRLDSFEKKLEDVQKDQKAIYKMASSIEVIASRVGNIEDKVDDTNRKVDAQSAAWRETEKKLSERVNEVESGPYKQLAKNVNSVKVAIVTAICTLLATGIVGAVITFGLK